MSSRLPAGLLCVCSVVCLCLGRSATSRVSLLGSFHRSARYAFSITVPISFPQLWSKSGCGSTWSNFGGFRTKFGQYIGQHLVDCGPKFGRLRAQVRPEVGSISRPSGRLNELCGTQTHTIRAKPGDPTNSRAQLPPARPQSTPAHERAHEPPPELKHAATCDFLWLPAADPLLESPP